MPRYFTRGQREDNVIPARITGPALREAGALFNYLLPYRSKFIGALICLALSSCLALTFPYVAGRLVDGALRGRVSDAAAIGNGDINLVALALILLLACQSFFTFFQTLWFNEVGERSLADLRQDTYARLIRLPMAFFSQRRVGELTSRIASDLTQIQDTLITTIPHLLRQLALLTGGMALIVITSPRLTLVMLVSLPVLIVVAALFGRRIRWAAHQAQDRLADSNVIVEETLQGVTNVKAFGNEDYEVARYRDSIQVFVRAALRGARHRAAFFSFIILALFGGVVLVLWYGAGLVQRGDLSAGELTRFLLYTMFVAGAFGSFADLYGQVQRTLGASQRVRELMRESPEVLEPQLSGGTTPAPMRGSELEFDRVTFRYPSRPEVAVLRGVSLAARAGERIALVGPSGAGKSTIVSLLLRFYEPDAGQIRIGGKDARTFPLAELRSHIAVVHQDVLLFGGSIHGNIAYGRPGAADAEIKESARQANAHDFIMRFPEGYQTRVGERGIQLSGGQRQRIAIARAVLKNPAILILDEATSSLDSESESLVQEALETLMRGRTTLIIAHRLATIRSADRIFVLKEGETVESGTHAELIDRADGIYRNLSELQFDLAAPKPEAGASV
jgi:ABC transporter fused permease/ATP-binding protein